MVEYNIPHRRASRNAPHDSVTSAVTDNLLGRGSTESGVFHDGESGGFPRISAACTGTSFTENEDVTVNFTGTLFRFSNIYMLHRSLN
jgi:hypothetical protein